jgi:pilus assembly protein Flp/PilA
VQFTSWERLRSKFLRVVRRIRGLDFGVTGIAGDRSVENLIRLQAKQFVRDERGATAIEYGLIAAGISVAIILVVNTLGSQLGTTFTEVSASLSNAGK